MLNGQIKIFAFDSSEYAQALQLRYRILRLPLGLEFTNEELEKDKHDIHVGLFEAEKILACITLTRCENKRMKMRQVAVAEVEQGKGLGRALSKAGEDYALENGVEIMFCNARKTAVPFYESMGYQIVSHEFTEVNIPHYTMEKKLGLLLGDNTNQG
ncbi:MAG: GNAT family N-acetyltransferase [Bacteroidetes bacterium]|nr:GNAT family N-acetyltransferase [Bacteroidota bacterium]